MGPRLARGGKKSRRGCYGEKIKSHRIEEPVMSQDSCRKGRGGHRGCGIAACPQDVWVSHATDGAVPR